MTLVVNWWEKNYVIVNYIKTILRYLRHGLYRRRQRAINTTSAEDDEDEQRRGETNKKT